MSTSSKLLPGWTANYQPGPPPSRYSIDLSKWTNRDQHKAERSRGTQVDWANLDEAFGHELFEPKIEPESPQGRDLGDWLEAAAPSPFDPLTLGPSELVAWVLVQAEELAAQGKHVMEIRQYALWEGLYNAAMANTRYAGKITSYSMASDLKINTSRGPVTLTPVFYTNVATGRVRP